MTLSAEQYAAVAAEVRGGVIRVQPSNEQACGYCDYRDCCRIRRQAAVISAGGGE